MKHNLCVADKRLSKQGKKMPNGKSLHSLRERQIVEEMGSIFSTISNGMVIPLFLFFWFADLLYIPELKWQTLGLRLFVVPIVVFGRYVLSRPRSFHYLQVTMSIFAFLCAGIINCIILISNDPLGIYYAGLNLIALGSLSFIPFTKKFLAITATSIYLPYYLISFFNQSGTSYKQLSITTFFIVGTLTICAIIQYFNENLRRKELYAQNCLNNEIEIRGAIIEKKTKEATQFKQLSTQFSPQVVSAFQNGEISINNNLRNQKICVVFIDIVNSTHKVISRKAEEIEATLEEFLKISVQTFLKYDLTIDKFQGDGILAFSNSPVEHVDFIDRVCMATLEVLNLFEAKKEYFKQHWGEALEVHAGIAVGYANVGFFGDKSNFRTFTAIGRPLPYASRLSALAKSNQILIDKEAFTSISRELFKTKDLGKHKLRGFDNEEAEVFELVGTKKQLNLKNDVFCKNHPDIILKYDLDSHSYSCDSCGYEVIENNIAEHNVDFTFLNQKKTS